MWWVIEFLAHNHLIDRQFSHHWTLQSRPLLLYAHGFSNLYPEYTVRRLSPELLSKQKPLVYELDGAEYVSSGVAPLDAGVLEEMVDNPSRLSEWV